MANAASIRIQIPQAYHFLFLPYSYKVCYGGRAAGRSWAYVRALLMRALEKKILILCCREIQTSIKESIYRLLVEQIETLGLQSMFYITDKSIQAIPTGSEFIFRGLFRNVNSVKSLEGVDICDVEEAETVSEESWKVLLPTVHRQAGSEVWIKFNTRYTDDPTYLRFVANPPKNAFVKFTTYKDNPYFSDESRHEMEADFAYRPSSARNIWDGLPIGAGMKIYPEFNESVHVKDIPLESVAAKAQCFMSMDPAAHYYPACLWLAQFPDPASGELIRYVYNEWPTRSDLGDWFHKIRKTVLYSGSLLDMSKEIYAHDGVEFGLKIAKRAIDTRFAKGSGSGTYYSGDTAGLVSEFVKKANGGISFSCPWEKSIDVARKTITADLQYNTLLPISAFNQPKLFISPRCVNLIQTMINHRLEEGTEKEAETYKDFSDAVKIMYATFSDEKYRDPKGQTQQMINPSPMYAGVGFESNKGSGSWMGM
jgi:hypothetical protein